MNKQIIIFTVAMFFAINGPCQTMTELVVPKYFGSKSASGANNCRTPFTVCLRIDSLVPGTSYDVKAGLGTTSDPADSYGAGNVWTGGNFQFTSIPNCFMTDATGSSGPFWIWLQPTGNGPRFNAGQVHNLRIGVAVNGQSMPGQPAFIGTKTMTALDIPNNPRTPDTADDGCFIRGSASPATSGKFVLLFDNEAGTGDPLFSYMIRQAVPTMTANGNELPTPIRDIYNQAGSSAAGDYPAVIPVGANNPNGVRRIESRNIDNSIYGFNTDSDGIWPGGSNTTTPVRREVLYITATDAPLIPPAELPVLNTDSITNIAHDSATGYATVVSDSGGAVIARGVCWSVYPGPTIAGDHSTESGTTGSYSSGITGLSPQTTYHVRAYATNVAGTAYGGELSFTTLCTPDPPEPDFYADRTEITAGDTINYTDASAHCPESWNWSFPGGIPMSSADTNPSGIVYNYPGIYNVCLTQTNVYGTRTNCRMEYITVNPPPAPVDCKIVITEIMYNPPESGTDTTEFIELYNNDTTSVDLEGFSFEDGIVFTFPTYELPPHAYVVVAYSDTAMLNTFGVASLEWTSGALSNSGELIRLKDCNGFTVDSVRYDDVHPWDSTADGRGPSLILCNPDSDNSYGENWGSAVEFAAVNANGDTIFASPGAGCTDLPVAGFMADNNLIIEGGYVTFTDTSSGTITSRTWHFEGGIPSEYEGADPPPVLYEASGEYDVSLTLRNIAGEVTDFRDNYIAVGVDWTVSNSKASGIMVFPNPSIGYFKIALAGLDPCDIEIKSLLGICIERIQGVSGSCEFHLEGLEKGMYLLRISNNSGKTNYSSKIIIR